MTSIDAGSRSLTSVLLPAVADAGLDGLAFSTFIDGTVSVVVSPVDQLLVAFTRRLVREAVDGVAVIQLPRARHRIALTLAICVHLLRMQEHMLAGPVVFAAQDVDMTAQLRTLRMRNFGTIAFGRDNPLSAQRLTRTGDLAPLLGSPPAAADSSLIYYSTRVGSPTLRCHPPLVLIDATSITNTDNRARVLSWAREHSAVATVIVGDIGDDSLVQTVTAAGQAPLVFPVTPAEGAAMVYDFGRSEPVPSPMSSMWMLWQDAWPQLSVQRAGDTEINAAIARGLACMASRPAGPMPLRLDCPSKLLNGGIRLAATVADYRRACALANRPGEGPGGLRNRLRRLDFAEPGRQWQAWGVAHWGELKFAVETLWRQLDEENPKLRLLWSMLDRANRSGRRQILIRCHSRAAAEATKASLTGEGRTDAQTTLWEQVGPRVEISTFATRYPPGYADIQILTANPPPWHFPLLLSGEAHATWMMAYDAEYAHLRRQISRWQENTNHMRRNTFHYLGATEPAAVASPVPAVEEDPSMCDPPALRLPGMSIIEVLNRAGEAIDYPSISGAGPGGWHPSGTTRSCVPVRLDDGRTWWVPNEDDDRSTPILVHTAAGERYLPLREVSPGDVVVVPAGDGTESVHARLVTISHTNDEVALLDGILEQFRTAARKVLRSNTTRRAAIDAVRRAGAAAAPQLTMWASGETIAPRSAGDIAAVFRAAQQPHPDLRLLSSVARTLRTLHRDLGFFVAALASGHAEDAVSRLRGLIGESAEELLDEFVVATVTDIGTPTQAPANLVGRLR